MGSFMNNFSQKIKMPTFSNRFLKTPNGNKEIYLIEKEFRIRIELIFFLLFLL